MNELSIKHAVIFGTGPVGLSVMDELVTRGSEVTLVNRSGGVGETLPAGVRLLSGDITDPNMVAAVVCGMDVAFLCAQPAYHEWAAKFPPIVAGVLDGLAGSGVRLVVADNLYMYGSTDGAPLHEGLPYAARGRKGRTRAEMARQLLAADRAGRVRVTIGRASDFFGPRVLGSAVGEQFFTPALAGGAANVLGDIHAPHTFTFIRDFARALVTLAGHEDAFGRAWHVPSAPTVTTREFADLLAAELGRPVRLRAAGPFTVTVLGLLNPTLREFKEMMYEFAEPFVVDHGQYESAFGNGATPHEDALRETVAWYRAHAIE